MSDLVPFESRIAAYAVRSKAANTVLAYRAAWEAFRRWAEGQGRKPFGDLDAVAGYLTTLADRRCAVSTVRVHLAGIKEAHRLTNLPFDTSEPRLAMVVEGIVRTLGVAPQRQAAAAVPDVLRRMLAVCLPDTDALGARDRAMLLLGFGAGLRRSEVVALRVGDVAMIDGRGMTVTLRRSKTDQHGAGKPLAIWAAEEEPHFCAVRAVTVWLTHRSRATDSVGTVGTGAGTPPPDSPLFCQVRKGPGRRMTGEGLTSQIVDRLVKKLAETAGLDPSRFSGHSLRRGMMTGASENGEQLADLMRHSRHKSVAVALGYIENSDIWRKNVTRRLFR